MSQSMQPMNVGFALGLFIGGWHLLWSVLVALGFAQPLIDFVLQLHMIDLPLTVVPFDLISAIELVLFTGVVGFGAGYVFAVLWNWAHR